MNAVMLTGHYVIADASGQQYLDIAELISVPVNFTTQHCLRFYYYMHGSHVQQLQVLAHTLICFQFLRISLVTKTFQPNWSVDMHNIIEHGVLQYSRPTVHTLAGTTNRVGQ